MERRAAYYFVWMKVITAIEVPESGERQFFQSGTVRPKESKRAAIIQSVCNH